MRSYVNPRRTVALFCAASMFMLCSCTRLGLPIIFNDDGKKADERLEQVIQAMKDKDKDALKAMFSKQALSEAEDIDGRIEYIFDFVQGDIVSWKAMVSGATNDNIDTSGQEVKKSRSWYSVKTDKEEYFFYLVEYTKDTAHPENVGLYFLQVIKMKDKSTQFGGNKTYAGIYKPDAEDTNDVSASPT